MSGNILAALEAGTSWFFASKTGWPQTLQAGGWGMARHRDVAGGGVALHQACAAVRGPRKRTQPEAAEAKVLTRTHKVQHTVVGVEGATVPDASPPDGAQDPPAAFVSFVIAALSPAPEHAAGADRSVRPPVQLGSPKVETVAEHRMPVGAWQVQALQARESTYEA
jgi:hypothetical protein